MTIYEIRAKGRELCKTEGSEHYKSEEGRAWLILNGSLSGMM